jgi:acyl-CoA thioesterase I
LAVVIVHYARGSGLKMTDTGKPFAVLAAALLVLAPNSAMATKAVPGADGAQLCDAPTELIQLEQSLLRTATRIAEGQPLRIVALGSSSTAGFGASSVSQSYPSRLEFELRSYLPGRDIVVINRGVNGQDDKEMLGRLQRSVLAARPDLVIWQVGTNALLDNYPATKEGALVRRGVKRLLDAGIDVVLMDPQYTPKVIRKPSAAHFVELFGKLGRDVQVGVFRRFAIMRHWNQGQNLPFPAFVSRDGLHMNDWSYGCTAQLLAGAILNAVTRQFSADRSGEPVSDGDRRTSDSQAASDPDWRE